MIFLLLETIAVEEILKWCVYNVSIFIWIIIIYSLLITPIRSSECI